MIVKDLPRRPKPQQTISNEGGRRATTRTILRVVAYVTNDDLGLERTMEPSNDSELDEADEIERLARATTDYVIGVKPEAPDRIVATRCFMPASDRHDARTFVDRAITLLADVDISHLRHVVLSDPVATIDEVVEGLKLVYGPRASILVAQHGDTAHPHYHAVIITVDPSDGKSFLINRGYDHEVLHLMAARSNYLTDTASEPNALFIADQHGIYDRYSGAKVSDLDLQFSVQALRKAREDRISVMKDNDAADLYPGWQAYLDANEGMGVEPPCWSDERVAKIMVRPRIAKAKSWEDLHRSLAMIGIGYEPHGGGARLVMHDESTIAATAAGSFASMQKLEARLGAFRPMPSDVMVRPFVRPRHNLRTLQKDERQNQQERRAEIRQEKDNLQKAIDEDCTAQSEAHRMLSQDCKELVSAARRETAKRWRPDERADLKDGPHSILAAHRSQRFADDAVHHLPALAIYVRKPVASGLVVWQLDGKVAFHVSRKLISIHKGADRLAALKLAQLKWGENFRFFGTKREIHRFCELAADKGIVGGNKEQRAMIEAMIAERERRANATFEAQERLRRSVQTAIAMAQDAQARARASAIAAFDAAIAVSQGAAARIAEHIKRHRLAPRGQYPTEHEPAERRGMLTLQPLEQIMRSTLVPWDDAPLGRSIKPVVEAFKKHPEDLDTRLVQARIAAEYYRQEAERRIMLNWLRQGLIRWNNARLESSRKEWWLEAALIRERDNPTFLKATLSNSPNDMYSTEPTILALALSRRDLHQKADMGLVRQELAWGAQHELGTSQALAHIARSHFPAKLKAVLQKDINGVTAGRRPTEVVDENLIKNMKPWQRTIALRHMR